MTADAAPPTRTSRWPRSGRPPRCVRCWSTRTPSPSRSRAAGPPARAPTCCAPRPGWRRSRSSGSGVVVRSYDAHPGDSLWVVAKVVFPEKSRSVEAATVVSTALNTARVALESGRIDEARAAFQTVQDQLAAVDDADGRAELAHQRDYLTTQLSGPAHAQRRAGGRAHRGPAAARAPGRRAPRSRRAPPSRRGPRRPSSCPRSSSSRASSPPRPATPRRRHRGPAAPPRPQRAAARPRPSSPHPPPTPCVRTARGQRARALRCRLRVVRGVTAARRGPACRRSGHQPARGRAEPGAARSHLGTRGPGHPRAVHARSARRQRRVRGWHRQHRERRRQLRRRRAERPVRAAVVRRAPAARADKSSDASSQKSADSSGGGSDPSQGSTKSGGGETAAASAEISVDGLAGSTLGAVTGVVASTTGTS